MARPLAELIGKEDWQGLGNALPRLRELRDRGLEWPSVGPVADGERAVALDAFSARVDGLAEALRTGGDVAGSYTAMMEALERAYDAVL